MIEIIYFIVGFIVSLLVLKRSLMKSGAGNCKMCKKCDYYLDSKKLDYEDEGVSENA
jgi:hypothetical protein